MDNEGRKCDSEKSNSVAGWHCCMAWLEGPFKTCHFSAVKHWRCRFQKDISLFYVMIEKRVAAACRMRKKERERERERDRRQ